MGHAGVGSVVRYSGVLVAGLAGGFVGDVATTLLYAIISETLFYFLSLCFIALLAALCVVFAGNALAGDGRRVRLRSVVGVGQAAAVVAALGNIAFADAIGLSALGLGRQMPVNVVVIAVVCSVAVWGLRRPPVASSAEAKDGRSVALLFASALLLLMAGVTVDGILNPSV